MKVNTTTDQLELEASRWIQNQPELKVYIGELGSVTLSDGVSIEVTGLGFTGAYRKLQEVLKHFKNNPTRNNSCLK